MKRFFFHMPDQWMPRTFLTVSGISGASTTISCRTGAVRISSTALGTLTPEIADKLISQVQNHPMASCLLSATASITLLVNLYGLAVDAITVLVCIVCILLIFLINACRNCCMSINHIILYFRKHSWMVCCCFCFCCSNYHRNLQDSAFISSVIVYSTVLT